uniref:Uncharacterized protein n=1 Tax=Ananas comosus var. bracteatus TaxID=296719 RepID=A0A6V7P6K1_ANACO|nr:unnamed protein product [Ananas comosus var. bracteatus]
MGSGSKVLLLSIKQIGEADELRFLRGVDQYQFSMGCTTKKTSAKTCERESKCQSVRPRKQMPVLFFILTAIYEKWFHDSGVKVSYICNNLYWAKRLAMVENCSFTYSGQRDAAIKLEVSCVLNGVKGSLNDLIIFQLAFVELDLKFVVSCILVKEMQQLCRFGSDHENRLKPDQPDKHEGNGRGLYNGFAALPHAIPIQIGNSRSSSSLLLLDPASSTTPKPTKPKRERLRNLRSRSAIPIQIGNSRSSSALLLLAPASSTTPKTTKPKRERNPKCDEGSDPSSTPSIESSI